MGVRSVVWRLPSDGFLSDADIGRGGKVRIRTVTVDFAV